MPTPFKMLLSIGAHGRWTTETLVPGEKKIDRILDVSGLLCPRPRLMTTRTLAGMAAGDRLEIISDDKKTRQTIMHVCRHKRYRLIEVREKHGLLHFVIEKC